ncbi:MAG: pyridoxal phosphate-dependent aminotransferase [Solirubrobacteraceae bacterium]
MPTISLRGKEMPESPIRKLVPYADKAKAAGKKIYHLNIGQPDIKTPIEALNAIRNSKEEIISYTHSQGVLSYRQKLVKYFKEVAGIDNLTPDNFVVTTGGSEALIFTLGSICDDGDEIIVPEPFYANYNGFTRTVGVKVVPIYSSIDDNFALPPIEEFEKKITAKTKAILICHPGNPSGYIYSREELEKLKDLVLKHNIFLISDEVYREFIYDDNEYISVLSFDELKNHAVIIDSESKRFSMCGARLGSVVSKNEEILNATLKFAQARLSPVFYGQIAAEAAHDADRKYIDDVRIEYTKRRNTIIKALNEIPNVKCPMPKGAFYCVAELPVDDAEKFSIWLLESFDLNGETVMLAPANGFYSDRSLGKKEVRLAYVLNEQDLLASVKIIRAALEKYPGRL